MSAVSLLIFFTVLLYQVFCMHKQILETKSLMTDAQDKLIKRLSKTEIS
jgi:hypothetical protein